MGRIGNGRLVSPLASKKVIGSIADQQGSHHFRPYLIPFLGHVQAVFDKQSFGRQAIRSQHGRKDIGVSHVFPWFNIAADAAIGVPDFFQEANAGWTWFEGDEQDLRFGQGIVYDPGQAFESFQYGFPMDAAVCSEIILPAVDDHLTGFVFEDDFPCIPDHIRQGRSSKTPVEHPVAVEVLFQRFP